MNNRLMLILSGLQGSGKSTYAKKLLEDNPYHWVRVNWDTQRRLTPNYRFSKESERKIKEESYDQVKQAALADQNVVIDNMNLSDSHVAQWTRLGSELGYHIHLQRMNTSVQECVLRDAQRTGPDFIGRAVIERTALWNGLVDFHPNKKIVIIDVDGTLMDCSHRRASKEKKCPACKNGYMTTFIGVDPCPKCNGSGIALGTDWSTFYRHDLIENDVPRYPVVEWARELYKDYTTLIVSGRPTDVGKPTVNSLAKAGVPYHHIFMRNAGDFRDDTIVKKEILEKILDKVPLSRIAFSIDDRNRVVDMWRENGVKCYQVVSREEGDF